MPNSGPATGMMMSNLPAIFGSATLSTLLQLPIVDQIHLPLQHAYGAQWTGGSNELWTYQNAGPDYAYAGWSGSTSAFNTAVVSFSYGDLVGSIVAFENGKSGSYGYVDSGNEWHASGSGYNAASNGDAYMNIWKVTPFGFESVLSAQLHTSSNASASEYAYDSPTYTSAGDHILSHAQTAWSVDVKGLHLDGNSVADFAQDDDAFNWNGVSHLNTHSESHYAKSVTMDGDFDLLGDVAPAVGPLLAYGEPMLPFPAVDHVLAGTQSHVFDWLQS